MKTLSCRDAGAACDFVAKGATEDEVIQDAKRHAKAAHSYDEAMFTPVFEQKLRSLIRDNGARRAAS